MKPRIGFNRKFWGWFFLASHIFGWAVAWAQTLWIIYELRKCCNELAKLGRRKVQ